MIPDSYKMTEQQLLEMFSKIHCIAKEYGLLVVGDGCLATMRWKFSLWDPNISDEIHLTDLLPVGIN